MGQVKQRALLRRWLLLMLILYTRLSIQVSGQDNGGEGVKKYGDKCESSEECKFEGSVCQSICQCKPELPVSNHLDKCGTGAKLNESCFFNEQCEYTLRFTECRDGLCTCRFHQMVISTPDGTLECVDEKTTLPPENPVDPTMIVILVVMILMCITICVVLRLFSKARWRENRTIFNTPNPRLMNASLLRENKLLHHERRGSKASVRGPSRQPSLSSLRPHSPSLPGSQRGSSTSIKSNKIPAAVANSASTPMLGSVTIEVQEPKA